MECFKEYEPELGKCPYCGSEKLEYDVILQYDNPGDDEPSLIHDIIDCAQCRRRVWEED